MSKTILITGCSSGFGLDAAKTLASKGHRVYATMRAVDSRNASSAKELRDYAQSEELSITVHDMDVTSDASVSRAVA
jgi:NAD(P)-dependent dehydrogenase (short-subunit alcohol dehydrogenase family)